MPTKLTPFVFSLLLATFGSEIGAQNNNGSKVRMPRMVDAPAPLSAISAQSSPMQPLVKTVVPVSEPYWEEGVTPDFLAPEIPVAAVFKFARAAFRIPKPTIIFRQSGQDALGRPHFWRHLDDAGFSAAEKPLIEQQITRDATTKFMKGKLQPQETIIFGKKPIEYRTFEIEPGVINIGRAHLGQMPQSVGAARLWTWRNSAWIAPLAVPSSSINRPTERYQLFSKTSAWEKPSLFSIEDSAPRYRLLTEFERAQATELKVQPGQLPTATKGSMQTNGSNWHPPLKLPDSK